MPHPQLTPDEMDFSIDLSVEDKQTVVDYLNKLVYRVTYEYPRFPDTPMDWACSTRAELDAMLVTIAGENGRVSWVGPESTPAEEAAHKAFREEIRQRLIASRR